ncbi:hypothetical protein ACLI4Z_10360 [Natrialbaceae archaeon A-arb3/5]
MTREDLTAAAESLRTAAGDASTDETRERLESQATQFSDLADADRGPDHGKLARHEHILAEIADEEGGAVANHVADALESIQSFRETLEGV